MDDRLARAVEVRIAEASGEAAAIRETRPVAGGSIHEARVVVLADGRRFFLKAGRDALYHLLNHLNLFGRSYREGAVARLRRLVG